MDRLCGLKVQIWASPGDHLPTCDAILVLAAAVTVACGAAQRGAVAAVAVPPWATPFACLRAKTLPSRGWTRWRALSLLTGAAGEEPGRLDTFNADVDCNADADGGGRAGSSGRRLACSARVRDTSLAAAPIPNGSETERESERGKRLGLLVADPYRASTNSLLCSSASDDTSGRWAPTCIAGRPVAAHLLRSPAW